MQRVNKKYEANAYYPAFAPCSDPERDKSFVPRGIPNEAYAYHTYGADLAEDYSPYKDIYAPEYWESIFSQPAADPLGDLDRFGGGIIKSPNPTPQVPLFPGIPVLPFVPVL